MSWKVSKVVREARLGGLYKDITPTEYFVLVLIADTCRGDSVVASISMSELETLTGLSRTTMSRAVRALIAKECIRRIEYGSQGQASKYAMLAPESRSADATWTRSADATCYEADHVASAPDHVANPPDHVAPTHRPRSAHATNPDTDLTIPSHNPASAPPLRASGALGGISSQHPTPPLMDHERCPKHEIPDPACATCRAFAHARGESLEDKP